MEKILKQLQEFINSNKENNIKIEIVDWKECGEYPGEDPRPILKIELNERILI